MAACGDRHADDLAPAAHLNRPAVFVYGGTILPGCITGSNRLLDIVSVFEAVGAHANHKIDDAEFQASFRHAVQAQYFYRH